MTTVSFLRFTKRKYRRIDDSSVDEEEDNLELQPSVVPPLVRPSREHQPEPFSSSYPLTAPVTISAVFDHATGTTRRFSDPTVRLPLIDQTTTHKQPRMATADSEAFVPACTNSMRLLQAQAFILTFISYATYHAARTPLSIVKSALHDWGPFTDFEIGLLDTTFLTAYAIGLFITGPLGDRSNLRIFLGCGLFYVGIACASLGLAETFNLHFILFFLVVSVFHGLAQATGWPAVVTVMARWFGPSGRGTIMGVWNAHSSIGNIVGKLVCSAAITISWGTSFTTIGAVAIGVGIMMFIFVIPSPADVYGRPKDVDQPQIQQSLLIAPSIPASPNGVVAVEVEPVVHEPLPFMKALLIPGVLEYSFSLFFSKLICYALGLWLPYYLVKVVKVNEDEAGYISTFFDWGGVVGGFVIGVFADWSGKSGSTSVAFALVSIPALFAYQYLATTTTAMNILFLFIVGVLVNGPYTLISSAVSADLGSHVSLRGNPLAMSTVTGIIDGFGSVGAAFEGILIGVLLSDSSSSGWTFVFYMLMIMSLACALCLWRIVVHEWTGHGAYGANQGDVDGHDLHSEEALFGESSGNA